MLHLVHCFRFPYCATLTSPVTRTMSTFTLDSRRMTALRRLRDWISSNDSPLKPAFGDNASDVSNVFATTHEPATGLSLVYFRQTSTKELDNIVSYAARAQQTWCCLSPLERSKDGSHFSFDHQLLHTVASLVRDEAKWLAELEVLDTGKPLWEAKADIDACADSIDLFAGFIPSLSGSHVTVPPNPSSFYYTRREPFGVCAGIGAWNFPFQMAVWKSAPALAAGNALVFKPSPFTPLTAMRLAELFTKAGCPDHLFSVVLGGSDVGQALVRHEGISKVSFTGSVAGGQAVLSMAALRIIPCTVELGGKSALIIMPDADLDEAVKGTLMANFYTQGQVCSNAARVFVHSSIFDAFTAKLMESIKRLQVGDPFLPDTSMGALITPEHLQKVLDYISGAVAEGATQLYGGTRPEFPEGSYLAQGNFLLPCILSNCNDQMKVVREEIFGPVITLLHFDDEDEVIRRANHSKLGLAGGVFTKDLATAHRIAAQLQCGSVYVNSFNYYPPGIPFGGYKQSGFGRENSFDSVLAHTQLKAVYVEGGKLPEPFPLS
ncbi:Betaine aldehyde dehydrogenase [Fasciola gigantica]|uniref:Betaine aldehyde dehydrogenase n=1 Tax=Fasciola gigantica TaxID=46835 RepID=A0A504Z3Y8_FASGI|nr:Betaine aldehyde dehydrogenase [Fasciola gigantica]